MNEDKSSSIIAAWQALYRNSKSPHSSSFTTSILFGEIIIIITLPTNGDGVFFEMNTFRLIIHPSFDRDNPGLERHVPKGYVQDAIIGLHKAIPVKTVSFADWFFVLK